MCLCVKDCPLKRGGIPTAGRGTAAHQGADSEGARRTTTNWRLLSDKYTLFLYESMFFPPSKPNMFIGAMRCRDESSYFDHSSRFTDWSV